MVAMIAAAECAVMLVVLVLLLAMEASSESATRLLPYSRRIGARRDGAHLVGDIGLVAMNAAAEGRVMLVMLVLLLTEVVSAESATRLLQ